MAQRPYVLGFAAASLMAPLVAGCSDPGASTSKHTESEGVMSVHRAASPAAARHHDGRRERPHGRHHRGHGEHPGRPCDDDADGGWAADATTHDAHIDDEDATAPGDGGHPGPATAFLRFAQFRLDLDYCVRPQGADETAWTGPLLRAFGRSDGEHLGGVTAYIPVAAGAYDLRSVRADATDCATPYPASTSIPPLPFFTSYGLTPIEAGARRTIVITGDAGRSNQLFELPDDFTTEPGTAKVRFVHTRWVYTDLTLGAGTGDSFVPWSPRTPPASQASNATYAAGYTQVPAGPGQTVTLRSGGNVELATIPFDVPEGAAITFFPYGGSPGDSLRACFDNAESVDGLTPCTLLLDAPQ